MKRTLKIVFMGTPEFAVPSLDILVQNGYDIAAVVTAPDKPSGRGQHVTGSAVKKYATNKNIHVLQPEKLKDEDFIRTLESLGANLFVVVAFRMLPEIVWQMPEYGTFNLHASLLPHYRGAAPINRAIINGEKETGVTTFFLKHEIDTGNILFREKIDIEDEDNAGTIHDKLSVLGAELVLKTVKAIEQNEYEESAQPSIDKSFTLQHAPKIYKKDCEIDWNDNAKSIHNLIRGLSPYPAAFTYLNGKVLKIYASSTGSRVTDQGSQFRLSTTVKGEPSTVNIKTDNKSFLAFQCADDFLNILELQLEGKKKMNIKDFLLGYKFS